MFLHQYSGFYTEILQEIDWTVVSLLVSTSFSAVAAVCGILFLRRFFREDISKESLFYLQQIQGYFARSLAILNDGNNNNSKWHQAVELLKTAEGLRDCLHVAAHKHIYYTEFTNTAHAIIAILGRIDSYKFFYGIKGYSDSDNSGELFEKSCPDTRQQACQRISPEALLGLCVFIDKANKAFQMVESAKAGWEEVFESEEFKVSLLDSNSISDISKQSSLKIIFDYINSYDANIVKRQSRFKITIPEDFDVDARIELG